MQQSLLVDDATLYIRAMYRTGTPLQGRARAELHPADIDAMIGASQEALVELHYIRVLARSLDVLYGNALREL